MGLTSRSCKSATPNWIADGSKVAAQRQRLSKPFFNKALTWQPTKSWQVVSSTISQSSCCSQTPSERSGLISKPRWTSSASSRLTLGNTAPAAKEQPLSTRFPDLAGFSSHHWIRRPPCRHRETSKDLPATTGTKGPERFETFPGVFLAPKGPLQAVKRPLTSWPSGQPLPPPSWLPPVSCSWKSCSSTVVGTLPPSEVRHPGRLSSSCLGFHLRLLDPQPCSLDLQSEPDVSKGFGSCSLISSPLSSKLEFVDDVASSLEMVMWVGAEGVQAVNSCDLPRRVPSPYQPPFSSAPHSSRSSRPIPLHNLPQQGLKP